VPRTNLRNILIVASGLCEGSYILSFVLPTFIMDRREYYFCNGILLLLT
jgi:hypothetical protein